MKKLIALLLCLVMALSLVACGSKQDDTQAPADDQQGAEETSLVDAAKAEGKLVVYGSCEEEYLAAACENFEKMYGIEVEYQRLSTGEVQAKIEEENGNPSADVWFGGTTDPYNVCAAEGLLEAYQAENASHITKPQYKNADGYWYGIYTGILGFMVNTDELERMGLEAPQDWPDLLKPEYKGLIWLSNYNTAGTAKLVINTMIQKYGHDEGIQYLVDLDKNIEVYTKSGSGPSKNVGTGECVIGIGFLHDGITQIIDNGYDNIELIIPSSGTSCEIGATAIFKGAAHPNAAKLWIEYALSPDCVNLAAQNGSYQFLVIDNATQPEVAVEFGLDPENVMDYDFDDATKNIKTYVEEVMNALAASAATLTGKASRGRMLIEDKSVKVPLTILCGLAATFVILMYLCVPIGAFFPTWGYKFFPLTGKWFKLIFTRYHGLQAFWDSFRLSLISAPITALLSMIISYLVVKRSFKSKGFIEAVSMLAMAVPGTVLGVGYIRGFSAGVFRTGFLQGLYGTGLILIIVFVVRSLPTGTRSGISALRQIDKSIEESAYDMGADSFKVFMTVTLPLIKDSFLSGLVTAFVRSITAISAIILLVTPQFLLITVQINEFAEKGSYSLACAFATILIVITYGAVLLMNLFMNHFGTSKKMKED